MRLPTPSAATATPGTRKGALRRLGFHAGAAALLIVGAAACGSDAEDASGTPGDAGASTPSAAVATTMINVEGFAYSPKDIMVKVGDKVTWTFKDASPHNQDFDDSSIPLIGGDEGLTSGKSADHTFDKAGTFKYKCGIHNYMEGSVTVA